MDANAKVDADITEANTTDVNTTSANRAHETSSGTYPVSKTCPIPHRLPLRSRTYSPSPDHISLSDSEVGFAVSLLIARFRSTVSRDSIQSRRPSVVSSAPPTPTGPMVLPLTAHRSSHPHLNSSLIRRAVALGCTYPGLILALAYTYLRYIHSSKHYARRCFVLLIGVYCQRDGGSPHSFHFLVDNSHPPGSHQLSQPGVPRQVP